MKNKHIKLNKLSPLIKYPGGKESELKYINKFLPDHIEKYYEPFLGGGAVYFSIESNSYYVNDKSDELMILYDMVKNQDSDFIDKLSAINHNWKLITKITSNHSEYLLKLFLDFYNSKIDEVELSSLIFEFILQNANEFNGLLKHDFNIAIDNFVLLIKKSLVRKYSRMKVLSKNDKLLSEKDILSNIESAFKASFYTHLRYIYNNSGKLKISKGFYSAIFFFIRQTCYSSMFRYNSSGEFNVPYGGVSYNSKTFDKALDYFSSKELINHLNKTTFGNEDFYSFISKYPPCKDDFIFLDPPYDSEFSTYANNEFVKSDQQRLADYLIKECKGKFMLLIKNTELISALYPLGKKTANGHKIEIYSFDKKYMVSFQNRNDRNVQHLLITNYK